MPAPLPGIPHVERDIEYGVSQDQSLTLDVYHPPVKGTGRPAVVVVHGGRWSQLDKRLLAGEAAAIAMAGIVAVCINYRMLNGMLALPSQIDNVRSAIRFLRKNAAQYGIDPARISMFGGSAGGQLSALASTQPDPLDPGARIKSVVIWSGFFDLLTLVQKNRQRNADAVSPLELAVGGPPDEFADRFRRFSATTHVNKDSPPFLIFCSTNEVSPQSDSEAFVAKLQGLGVAHELVVYEGNAHMREYSPAAMPQTIAFLQKHG